MSSFEPDAALTREIKYEQAHLDRLHLELAARRRRLIDRRDTARQRSGGTAEARLTRNAEVEHLQQQIARADAAAQQLCFGRLDDRDGHRRYVGRLGLPAADPEADPLLIDWRAPAARPFYTATPADPQGVRRRRHLYTRGSRLLRVDDDLLDDAGTENDDLVGEGALLAALRAERTGRMQDVVATLQAEQDRIVRSPEQPVLVVDGGPGTGKTVVALHRAAYLLYTRPQLDRRGVLVVGPTPVFLSYIRHVLPGLGETGVVLTTAADLMPGVSGERPEPDEVAEIKGRLLMADVVANAVRARQAPGRSAVTVSVGGENLLLERSFLDRAADQARVGGRAHHRARLVFARTVVAEIAYRLARSATDQIAAIDAELADQVDLDALDRTVTADLAGIFGPDTEPEPWTPDPAEIDAARAQWRADLPHEPAVRALLDQLWPPLTPMSLLEKLFDDRDQLDHAAGALPAAERELLRRPSGGGWSAADVPLLDEAAELLGVDDRDARQREARERRADITYAQGVLDVLRGSREPEADDLTRTERLGAADLLSATQLAERNEEPDLRTLSERAAGDRTWTYGHVIVDEAQDVSPMAWRVLARRCPARSFTVVGDIAQHGATVRARSWAQALDPVFGGRWTQQRLTVNYRTPKEIMAAADPVRAALHPDQPPARAVRSGAALPWRDEVGPAELAGRLAEQVRREVAAVGAGRVAVIGPGSRRPELATAVVDAVPAASWGRAVDLDRPVVVLTPGQARGLEFDSVLVVDPQRILAAGGHGLNDLYVALTRAVQRLGVLHSGPIPPVLDSLARFDPGA